MKKVLFLMMVVLAIAGCSNNYDEEIPSIPESPKEYLISLGYSGEITDITERPLNRVATNDIYGIQVYSMPINGAEYKAYAYGLFDSSEGINIKLLDGYKYKFSSTMVVNGKTKLESYNNVFHLPFVVNGGVAELKNTFTYSSTNEFGYLGSSLSDLKDGEMYTRPNLDRYYGESTEYTPSLNGTVSIKMKRVSFGAKFIAKGFSEGTINIAIEGSPIIKIEYPESQIQDIFTFTEERKWTEDNYSENAIVSITWEKNNGAIIPLVNQPITFKRNKLIEITVETKDSSTNNEINIDKEDSEMGDGGSLVI